ncbi:enoyl-CoA hydratase/isomerase family protein [Amycolatopsis mediterranei]|uniref:enoyl-CoA hydratase/isomerase family protein n=1 Tax=Amycolatopsis mediterranei TaxID=33910 RepID=UPI00343B8D08
MVTSAGYELFESVDVEISRPVATVKLLTTERVAVLSAQGSQAELHFDLGRALARLREDDAVRVVVITGIDDGAPWILPAAPYAEGGRLDPEPIDFPDWMWKGFQGVRLTQQTLAEMEKPVIARVNGDCIGFSQSIMFGCDLIVARDDAIVADVHMDLQKIFGFDTVPGDGGGALVPLHMFPAKAMEYLLLAKPYTAAELADMGAINYAVPPAELDQVVDGMVRQLVSKSAYALALTKRVVKRRVAEQLNLTLDAASAYEWINFLHYRGSNGKPNLTL